jgi:DNA-binding XRE family transcriptional regulator
MNRSPGSKRNRVSNNQEEASLHNGRGASSFVDDSQQKEILYQRFSIQLKSAREKAGMTQEQLSQIVSIDRTYLSQVENGRRNVSLYIAYRLARALDISLDEMLKN